LIGAAAYLLYEAWTNNWGGIQEKTAAVWGWIQGKFELLKNWLANELPIHLTALSMIWESVLLPKIKMVWEWIDTHLMPLFRGLGELMGTLLRNEVEKFGAAWELLKGPLGFVANVIQEYVVWAFGNLNSVIRTIAPYLGEYVAWAFRNLTAVIDGVTWAIGQLNRALGGVKLPAALTPGSPTPFEIGLRGIGDALEGLSGAQLPAFKTGLELQPLGMGAISASVSARAGGGPRNGGAGLPPITIQYYDQAVVSSNQENEIIDKLGPALVEFLRQKGVL
jgi:hypothetical protein